MHMWLNVKKIDFDNEIARFNGLVIYVKKASSTNAIPIAI